MPAETAPPSDTASTALQTVKTLADALWFPVLFAVGFMFCYLLPFHSPHPRELPVAVQGEEAAAAVSVALDEAAPGGFDVTPVDDAERAVHDRDAVAGYSPQATSSSWPARSAPPWSRPRWPPSPRSPRTTAPNWRSPTPRPPPPATGWACRCSTWC
ncbi:hypothetical protein ACFQXA_33455 [Nocardiopsis composta]